MNIKPLGAIFAFSTLLLAQSPIPAQPPDQNQTAEAAPVYRVTVVSRTIRAINYHHRTGTTQIDFQGTDLMPEAKGDASVESRMGSTKIDVELEHLRPANSYGPEFLTYVLWAITPEGRAQNLGELVLEGNKSKLLSTTDLQAFGLIVTAEPYFAVTQPSDVVVMENFIRHDTTGTFEQVDAKYELLPKGAYTLHHADYVGVKIDPKGPLQLAEAENAVQIAKLAGAEAYAADTLQKALWDLQNAEGFAHDKNYRKDEETTAREATQMAEDARIITIRKMDDERLAQERADAAERESEAKAQAAAEAQRRVQAEMARQSADADLLRADAERQRAEEAQAAAVAQQQAAQAETEKARQEAQEAQTAVIAEQQAAQAEAEKARQEAQEAQAAAIAQQQAAQAEAEKARQDADEANRTRLQAEKEKTELRSQLLKQLNLILQTRDTARGLIVNMSDVLFDTGKYELRPVTREKLAKISGIVLTHPGLVLSVEGYTDSVGSDDYNQRLSEQRASAVRDYFVKEGIPADAVTAKGFGKTQPVASNDTAQGRQQNRRVELVVSGDVIGEQVGALQSGNSQQFGTQDR